MRCHIGSKSDEPCMGTAAYLALDWARHDELSVCAKHASDAKSDGAEVVGLDGEPLPTAEDDIADRYVHGDWEDAR